MIKHQVNKTHLNKNWAQYMLKKLVEAQQILHILIVSLEGRCVVIVFLEKGQLAK